jgi:hypothetical protein
MNYGCSVGYTVYIEYTFFDVIVLAEHGSEYSKCSTSGLAPNCCTVENCYHSTIIIIIFSITIIILISLLLFFIIIIIIIFIIIKCSHLICLDHSIF